MKNSKHEVTDKELVYLKLALDWNDRSIRMRAASEGVALNVLINDSDPGVRQVVAQQFFGLEVLVNDEDVLVRQIARAMADVEKEEADVT